MLDVGYDEHEPIAGSIDSGLLPERSDLDAATQYYLTKINVGYQCHHEPTLIRQLESIYDGKEHYSQVDLFTALGKALRFRARLMNSADGFVVRHAGTRQARVV